jgi:hypothetical protein
MENSGGSMQTNQGLDGSLRQFLSQYPKDIVVFYEPKLIPDIVSQLLPNVIIEQNCLTLLEVR